MIQFLFLELIIEFFMKAIILFVYGTESIENVHSKLTDFGRFIIKKFKNIRSKLLRDCGNLLLYWKNERE